MDLRNQNRMASDLLKCGLHRVWIDPNRIEDVSKAVTRGDIRSLIHAGAIMARQKKGISSGRSKHRMAQKKKGKRKGHGSRKGAKRARTPKKRRWIQTIRPIRARLKEHRAEGRIDRGTYRKYYRQSKGGMFKSKSHLETHMRMENAFRPQDEWGVAKKKKGKGKKTTKKLSTRTSSSAKAKKGKDTKKVTKK